jgi:hypothetical protein
MCATPSATLNRYASFSFTVRQEIPNQAPSLGTDHRTLVSTRTFAGAAG